METSVATPSTPATDAATVSASASTSPDVASSSSSSSSSTATATGTSAKAPLSGGYAGDPMTKYGTHQCTCDGCNARPIIGFRYKCLKCKDHDICENCYASFQKGNLPHVNKLNPVPKDVAAHAFAPYVDGKAFTAMAGAKKQTTKTGTKKVGPNDPCSCGSGKKYKKCCFK